MLLESTTIGLVATMTLTNPMSYETQMTDSLFGMPQYNHENSTNLDSELNYSNTLAPYEEYLFEKKMLELVSSNDEFVINRFVKNTVSASFEVTRIRRKPNIFHFD